MSLYLSSYSFMPCALLQRLTNPTDCIQFMNRSAADQNLFWFGTKFQQLCQNKPPDPASLDCFPAVPQGAPQFSYQTLGSHMFNDDNYNINGTYLNQLQYPLSVTYTSPPGMVSMCNTTVSYPQYLRWDANPQVAALGSFFFRNAPEITPPPVCTMISLCTLMFFDVGNGLVHSIFVNWPKNSDFSRYTSPGLFDLERPNPFAWLVFQQQSEITTFQQPGPLYQPFQLNLPQFMQQYVLTGPIALTWFQAHSDLYGYKNLVSLGFPANSLCAQVLDSQLKHASERNVLQRDLGLTRPVNLIGWMTIRYRYRYPARGNQDVWLDPIKNRPIPPQYLSNQPDVILDLKIFPAGSTPADYQARTFTLLLVRRDVSTTNLNGINPCLSCNNNGSVFVNWLKVNIPGQDLSQGTDILSYRAPMAIPAVHYYLLYRQPSNRLKNTNGVQFSPNCPMGMERRCQFALQNFTSDNGLTLEAMSRFQTAPSTYGYYTVG